MCTGRGNREAKARVKIDPAQPSDLPAIRWLLGFEGLPCGDLTEHSLTHFRVLRGGGDIIGAIGLECFDEIALLRSLVVAEEHRGKAYGVALARAAETLASTLGIRHIYLLTTSAEFFFSSRGYRRIHRDDAPSQIQSTAQFSALCPATAVLMVKP